MKVLFCSPLSSVGGISRWTQHILNYYQQYPDEQIKIEQYYGRKKTTNSHRKFLGARLYYGVKEYWPLYREVVSKLRNQKYQIVHLCSSASISLLKDILILRAAKKYGVKSCIHFHFGRIPAIIQKKNWEYKLLLHVLNLADSIIIIDNSSYKALSELGYKNLYYLPNPLAPEINEIILSNNIDKIPNKIVFAGHVVRGKGVYELVEACKDISNIDVEILGAVSDEMKNELFSIAGTDSKSWLHVLGEKSYVETIHEMLSAGVFVLPTYTEGFPNVILESMACGCPIVTTDVGAIPEMLDIEHGFNYGICVKPKDVVGLKSAIEKMLYDREYASQCGKNAQERVNKEYSMSIVWENLIKIWRETLVN